MSLWFEHNRIPLGSSVAEVGLLLEETVKGLGLDQFAYAMLKPPQGCQADLYSTLMTNYPQQWVERHIEQDYGRIDPVVERVLVEMRPFVWPADSSSPDPRRQQLLDEARAFGHMDGIVLPIRDRHGAVGAFTGVACDEDRVRDAVQHHAQELLAAAWDAHEFAVDRVRGERDGGDAALTLREKECLLWTLEGKTAQDIAAILNLSVFTVNRHAHNATHKLGSLNKHHAAMQAFRAGLI
ncbi:MAG: autoinducer binding domain-containing protein [Gemmatimonadota bacterium]|nr:autoinducer binding domain-containing protein [Gemmatimonadota bacterium]